MKKLRRAALPVGFAMRLIFTIMGFTSDSFGLAGLGVVLRLVGCFSKPEAN